MDRAADLRADYERLGLILVGEVDGAKAAALARERRLLGVELERLEAPKGSKPYVDQVKDELAAKRGKAGAGGPAVRRRKSG